MALPRPRTVEIDGLEARALAAWCLWHRRRRLTAVFGTVTPRPPVAVPKLNKFSGPADAIRDLGPLTVLDEIRAAFWRSGRGPEFDTTIARQPTLGMLRMLSNINTAEPPAEH